MEGKKSLYDEEFYKKMNEDTNYTAQRVLGQIVEYYYKPESIIDIGCGTGMWLYTAEREFGIKDICGLDGEYVPAQYRLIPDERFIAVDLESTEFKINRKYDLAICLEVAEHISKNSAIEFIQNLCHASDIVLFSAAIPWQGGTNHINEQRLSYWERLFNENNYVLQDIIRPEIWNDEAIPRYYRNNIVIFCRTEKSNIFYDRGSKIIDIVLPDLFEKRNQFYNSELEKARDLSKKHYYQFKNVSNWIRFKQNGGILSDDLIQKGFKNIGIYGVGEIGELLIEELKSGDVNIAFGIDKDAEKKRFDTDVRVISPSMIKENIDAIIITVVLEEKKIISMLKTKVTCPIFSLQELISDFLEK